MRDQPRLRRGLSWVVLALAATVAAISIAETFTADPHEGEGWIGGPIQLVFAAGPLVAVALGLRSQRRIVARRTALVALLLAMVVAFVLVMQLLDPNETLGDRLLQAVAAVVYFAAFGVEVPALSGDWPAAGNGPGSKGAAS